MSPPANDVSLRLTLFGLLAIVIGAIAALLGLFQALLPFLADSLSMPDAAAPDLRTSLIGGVVYVALGAVIVWAGIGSMRRKRWVRPVMLFLAWSWLLGGILLLAIAIPLLDDLGALASVDPARIDPTVDRLLRIFVLGVTIVGGIVLPAAFVWAYRDRRVSATCELHDPTPSFVDRCPTPVLALSFGLWAAAALTLPLVIQPVVPLFGWLLSGLAGALVLLVVAALCAWAAWAVYRRQRSGWWTTLTLLTVAGLSLAWTLWVDDSGELYRRMGYPDEQLEAFRNAGLLDPVFSVALTLLATLLTAVYMIWIRRHFDGADC